MKTKFFLNLCLGLISVTLAVAAGTDDKAVRDADDAWSKAAGAHDLEKIVSFYSNDAIVLPPNGAAITTKDGVHDMWKQIVLAFA